MKPCLIPILISNMDTVALAWGTSQMWSYYIQRSHSEMLGTFVSNSWRRGVQNSYWFSPFERLF